jgi:hypothetical protein
LTVAVVLAVTMSVGFVRPVGATVTGGGTLVGVGVLTQFPCPDQITCPGNLGGTVALSLSGLGTTTTSGVPTPYTAVWAGTGNFTSVFTARDFCLANLAGLPPATGLATGTFTLSGGTVVYPGGTLASATLSGNLSWERYGTSLVILFTSLVISGGPGATTFNPAGNLVGSSPAGFVMTNGPGTCPANFISQNIAMAGVAIQPT